MKMDNILYRIIIVGEENVGKTSVAYTIVNKEFNPYSVSTIGVDFYSLLVEIESGINVKLHIWDAAGKDQFKAIIQQYYSNVAGAIVMYDITNKESFLKVEKWLQELYNLTRDDIRVLLVGCKTDLAKDRVVSFAEGDNLARQYKILFLECSAKNRKNINQIFPLIANDIHMSKNSDKKNKTVLNNTSDYVSLNNSKNCCTII